MKRIFIPLIFVYLTFNFSAQAGIINPENPQQGWKDARAYRPSPVLLLHGFGPGGSHSWTEANVDGNLNTYYSKYYRGYNSDPTILPDTRYPYLEIINFGSSLIDRNSSIDTYQAGDCYVMAGKRKAGDPGWSDKLNLAIEKLRNYYVNRDRSQQKIVLVTHSMGGLAAREYLRNYNYANQKIEKLIMIGTPNLGSYWAESLVSYSVTRRLGWLYGYGSISLIRIAALDKFLESTFFIDMDGDAVCDMDPSLQGSGFIREINDNYPELNEHFVIAGKHWSAFNSGDTIVSLNSQLGKGVLALKDNCIIKSTHWDEPAIAVSGDNPLLKFLDSNRPEISIISPDPSQTTELKEQSVRVKGLVYKEYLPADSKIIINVKRQEDGISFQAANNYLKPSDLWIPNNPDSPVAEFDEEIKFPGNGTYKIYCSVRNPAGIFSESKILIIKVVGNIEIYPIENISLHAGTCYAGTMLEAIQNAQQPSSYNPLFWPDFLIGQSIRKHYNVETEEIHYAIGLNRIYLSFDTSSLADKKIKSAKLIMYCYDKPFKNGGRPFDIRIYSANWGEIKEDFVFWDAGTELVAFKNSNSVIVGTFDEYLIPISAIDKGGKTQFRICSSNEEDLEGAVEPPMSEGTCFSIDNTYAVFEMINWDKDTCLLQVELDEE